MGSGVRYAATEEEEGRRIYNTKTRLSDMQRVVTEKLEMLA